MYVETTATRKISQLHKRIRGIAGGTSASKTVSILALLIRYAQEYENQVISIVSETLPHLKKGAVRDFLNLMYSPVPERPDLIYFDSNKWNKTDCIYTFPNGSVIEFFSVFEHPERVRGPRRDILFINEANNISYETFTQLEIRTKKIILLDWNPSSEYWFYSEVAQRDDVDFITLTYKDNEALDTEMIRAIEARRNNKNWWKVYGEGQLGESEAQIYNNWTIIDNVFPDARLERYGLDFGYSNDPAAIVAVYKFNNTIILDEILYQKGMSNLQLATTLKQQPERSLVIADSSEPKSIDELRTYGIKVIPSLKGADSVLHGIQYIQSQNICVTKRSIDLIKEYRNYLWMTDKNGKIINEPEGGFEHLLDASRYAIVDSRRKMQAGGPIKYEEVQRKPVIWTAKPDGSIAGFNLNEFKKEAEYLKERGRV